MYILAFHGVSVVWRLKGIRGDRVLLVAAHLLTAIGLAAMISRPDPLRDLLLFPLCRGDRRRAGSRRGPFDRSTFAPAA